MQLLYELFPWIRESHPALLKNKAIFRDFDQSRPLADYIFVVFDTELTGLNKRRDEIISIGAVKILNLHIELSQSFHQYIRPRNMDPNQATFVHRITPEQLRNAPPIEKVLHEFLEFCGPGLLVGHYVGIDMHFLNRAAKKVLGGTLSNPCIDTMRMARAYQEALCAHDYGYCDQSISYSLDALSEKFDLPRFKSHDALEDALQTAYLFMFLLKKMKSGGIKTLRDLYKAGRIWRML
ncbi:MAG TPA: 3'-5' exonuclease [Thermodesulfobacteriaceae bacterium]|nr:3'-5' exonuclease [Thermodesulfobacteriaceae bacterium]